MALLPPPVALFFAEWHPQQCHKGWTQRTRMRCCGPAPDWQRDTAAVAATWDRNLGPGRLTEGRLQRRSARPRPPCRRLRLLGGVGDWGPAPLGGFLGPLRRELLQEFQPRSEAV